jgi:long-chain acyl-CoA synthetase
VDPTPVRGSAGKLVPGALLKVVGPDGREVHPGGIGEALAWSPGLMLGYWGDEEQTSKALTDDGFYRQKDLVRVDADGYVYVVGRISDMIIRGGSNISPAEVERVLREHPTVRDVAVVGLPDDVYGQRVTAAVLLPDGVRFDPEVLSSFASTQLSSFKLPSDYVVLDEFPVNKTTGKVDRKSIATALEKVGETR